MMNALNSLTSQVAEEVINNFEDCVSLTMLKDCAQSISCQVKVDRFDPVGYIFTVLYKQVQSKMKAREIE